MRGAARLIAFFALVAAVVWAADGVISAGLRRVHTSSFGVWNGIVNGSIDADILITGSSRALNHYDPRAIQRNTGMSSYNIGLNGSQIDMQLARLQTYLVHNRKPRLVIHNLDLFTFQTSHGGVYEPGQYIPYLHEPSLFDRLAKINPDFRKSKVLPLYGYVAQDSRLTWMLGVGAFFGIQPKEDHILGFNPRYVDWTGDFERFEQSNRAGVHVEIESGGIEALEQLAELCAERDIKLLLVYSPEFVQMHHLTSNRAEVFHKFQQIADEFAVPLWDYSDSAISGIRGNFYNSQHLNAKGAEQFSEMLASRIARELGSIPVPRSHVGMEPAGGI